MSADAFLSSTEDDRSLYPYDTSHVSELLKRKRRSRGIKACFPCRHRKVRCDGNSPCSTCVQRNHTELCRAPVSSSSTGRGLNPISGTADDLPLGDQERTQDTFSTSPGQEQGRDQPEFWDHELRNADTPGPGNPHPLSPQNSTPHQERMGINVDRLIDHLENVERQIVCLRRELAEQGYRKNNMEIPADNPYTNLVSWRGPTGLSSSEQVHRLDMVKPPRETFVEDATGATIFLGGRSDHPLSLGCRQSGRNTPADTSISHLVPKTYSFTNIWRHEVTHSEIYETLPDDLDITRYWQSFQSFCHPFYPALVTLEQFSASLFAFLDRRAATIDNEMSLEGENLSWLALLFAVLACGVQFSSDGAKERELRSKVFSYLNIPVCSSFQCLRMANFLNSTDIDQVQALALIGHCQRNNSDANSAWILLGSTVRLAQSIGIHEDSFSTETHSQLPSSPQSQRKRLWWMLLWQDAFLAFTYDRPYNSSNAYSSVPYTSQPPDSQSTSKGLCFADSVFKVLQILQLRAQHEMPSVMLTSQESCANALNYKAQFEKIFEEAAPFLIDKALCRTIQDHLERLALGIHVGYAVCRMCRLVLEQRLDDPKTYDHNDKTTSNSPYSSRLLAEECVWRASRVIEGFLDIHRLSPEVCRSWAFVHNVTSCAMTLKYAEEMTLGMASESKLLIKRLIGVVEKEEEYSSWFDEDANRRCFGPYGRALEALRHVYNAP